MEARILRKVRRAAKFSYSATYPFCQTAQTILAQCGPERITQTAIDRQGNGAAIAKETPTIGHGKTGIAAHHGVETTMTDARGTMKENTTTGRNGGETRSTNGIGMIGSIHDVRDLVRRGGKTIEIIGTVSGLGGTREKGRWMVIGERSV